MQSTHLLQGYRKSDAWTECLVGASLFSATMIRRPAASVVSIPPSPTTIMPISLSRRWHVFIVLLICGCVALAYAPITNTYFCGFDDFFEVHRATFEDAQTPSKILTTGHRGGNKYRPLYRLANDVTYWWGNGSATLFHVRNLFFHCLMVASVYGLGVIFFSWPVATAAALLFGLHPMVHQSVAVATFYNAAPNLQFLLTFVLPFIGYRSSNPVTRWSCISMGLICGALGVFTYEPVLAAFGLIYLYFIIDYFVNGRVPNFRFLATFTACTILAAGTYFVARAIFVPELFARNVTTPPSILLRNLAMYLGALCMPVDLVLAHDWIGTPLPRDIQITPTLVAIATVAILATGWFFGRPTLTRLRGLPATPMIFLLAAIPTSLLLFLVYTDHASETYVPVPAALFCLAAAACLWQLLQHRPVFFSVITGLLVLSSLLACLNRDRRVVACGDTAIRILGQLPGDFRTQRATVWLSHVPGEVRSYPYGIYGFKGFDTIGLEDLHVANAVQAFFRNEQLNVRLVAPSTLLEAARHPAAENFYFFVHADGKLSSTSPSAERP